MAKKETLKLANNDFTKVILYTIASSESDISLCMIINKAFQIDLSLSEDLIVKTSSETLNFKKYLYYEDTEDENFTLLINKHPSGNYLFPEFKKIDYIFIISSELSPKHFDSRIKSLKEFPGISAVFKIDPVAVKSFKKLVL